MNKQTESIDKAIWQELADYLRYRIKQEDKKYHNETSKENGVDWVEMIVLKTMPNIKEFCQFLIDASYKRGKTDGEVLCTMCQIKIEDGKTVGLVSEKIRLADERGYKRGYEKGKNE